MKTFVREARARGRLSGEETVHIVKGSLEKTICGELRTEESTPVRDISFLRTQSVMCPDCRRTMDL